MKLGLEYLKRKEIDSSEKYLFMSFENGNARVWAFLGDIYRIKEKYEFSRFFYEKALDCPLNFIEEYQVNELLKYYKNGTGGDVDIIKYNKLMYRK